MTSHTGSIFTTTNQSGNTVWKVEVVVGYAANGRKRTIRKTAHSKRDAEHLRRRLLNQLDTGVPTGGKSRLVREFALWWIREVQARRIKPSTAADYEFRYRTHIDPTFGEQRLDAITARHITQWLTEQQERYSDATVNGALQVLKMMLKAAVLHRELAVNPAAGIPRLTRPKHTRVKSPWTRDEAARALQASKGDPLELPLLLGIHLGLRIGEIIGLRWSDMDFAEGTVEISRAVREVRQYDDDGTSRFGLVEATPKTLSSRRCLALTYDLQSALLTHRERLQDQGHYSDSGWVLATGSDNPVRPQRLSKLYREFLTRHELRPIRFHDLRHTAAVLGLEAGVRIEAVSQNLGHSSIDVTKTIYAPHVGALSREYAEGIQKHLQSTEPIPHTERNTL